MERDMETLELPVVASDDIHPPIFMLFVFFSNHFETSSNAKERPDINRLEFDLCQIAFLLFTYRYERLAN